MITDDMRRRLRKISHGAGRIAVGPNTKRILALDFEQICHFLKDLGDFCVFHEAEGFGAGFREALLQSARCIPVVPN